MVTGSEEKAGGIGMKNIYSHQLNLVGKYCKSIGISTIPEYARRAFACYLKYCEN
jgi:hypothetical protein